MASAGAKDLEMTFDHSMAVLFPIVTLLLGYILSSISESVRHRRALEREREAREAERRDKEFGRRVTFQRGTTLDLQDAVMGLMRTSGGLYHKKIMALEQKGEGQKKLYDGEHNERNRLA